MDAKSASVSIGKQEAQNQQLERAAASQIQNAQIEGEVQSRKDEESKISTLMGMDAADMQAANMKEQAANQAKWDGISSAAGGVTSALTGGVGGKMDFQNPFWKQQ